MEKLKSLNSLFISQKREWLEILTTFECKNKYVILDEYKEKLYYAAEKGGSALSRYFLNMMRPFTIEVLDADNQVILSVKRPYSIQMAGNAVSQCTKVISAFQNANDMEGPGDFSILMCHFQN